MGDDGYEPFPDLTVWTGLPYDPTTYEQYAALLADARAKASPEARERAVRTAIRYAGTDTGAIEGLYTTDRGFTRTVAIEAASWEAAAAERGPNAAQIIKDQIAAYEWVLDVVTEKDGPVTEHLVRELHAMICRSQDTYVVQTAVGAQERPLPKGEYKTNPNNPTSDATGLIHHYAPPDSVPAEMHRLVNSLSTDEYRKAHPVIQTAYLHYALVAIHPFADGNGRTTRALASVPLYRALSIPLVILRDERDAYLDALASADAGDRLPFVSFVAQRVVDTIDLVVFTLRAGAAADQARSLERLRQVVTSIGGRTHQELDAIANRLLDVAADELRQHVSTLALPTGVSVRVEARHHRMDNIDDYRMPVENPRIIEVTARSEPPATGEIDVIVSPYVATRDGLPALLLASDGPEVTLALEDVEPVVRTVATIKLASFAERLVTKMLDWLAEVADDSLRAAGYRP